MSDTASWITAGAAVVTAFYIFLTWRSYKNIEWFTGSMENYESVKIRLEALKKAGITPEFLWWDPTVNGHPTPNAPRHGKPIDDPTIYLYVPRRERSVSFNVFWSLADLVTQARSYFLTFKKPRNWKS